MPTFVSKNYLLAFDYQPPTTANQKIHFIHSSSIEQSILALSRLDTLYPDHQFYLLKREGVPFPGLKFSKLQTHTYQETILPPNFILPELENPQEKNKPGLVFFCVNLKIGIVEKMEKPPDQIEEVEFEAIAAKLKERYANILDYLKNSQLLEAAFIIDKNFQVYKLTHRDIESWSGICEIGEESMYLPRTLLTLKEREVLFHMGCNGPAEGAIVNIGSFLGGSSIILAKGSKQKDREKVYSFDPKTYPLQEDYLEKNLVSDWIMFQQTSSENGIKDWKKRKDTKIRLLFIDGDHSFAGCRNDIALWSPYLVLGGIIAIHDYCRFNYEVNFDGIVKAVHEMILCGEEFHHYRREDYLFLAQKK